MFKKSFNKIVREPSEKLDDMPLIAALSMDQLEMDVEETTVIPLICKHCGAIAEYNKLNKKKESTYEWICGFCENSNEIKLVDIKQQEDIEKKRLSSGELSLLFKEIIKEKIEESGSNKSQITYGDSLIAIIDISGSMSGGKLESVKHSLIQTIKNLKVNHPDTIFSLIEFTDHVGIYPTPENIIHISDDEALFSRKGMRKSLRKSLEKIKIGPVGEFGNQWVEKIDSLKVKGWTALGPGLFAGQVLVEDKIIAAGIKGSRLLLLTDGLANIGMGKVEGESENKAVEFYEQLANECMKNGIIIDVIGVTDNSNTVALNVVGKITDITGGEMVFITKEQIESTMSSLRQKQYIAKNTVLKVFTPPDLELSDITGTYISKEIPKESGAAIELGALYPSREIYLKFKQNRKIKGEKIPIQIQLEYLDKNNVRKTRMIRTSVDITDNFDEYTKNYDAELYANIEIQRAGKFFKNSEMRKAKEVLSGLKSTLGSANFSHTIGVSNAFDMTDSEEEEWDKMEEDLQSRGIRDSKSYFSSLGQSVQRKSLSMRKSDLKAKKKKKET